MKEVKRLLLLFEISPSYRSGKIKKNSLRLSQKRISEIVGNTKFGNIDNLLSQGQDMDYIVRQLPIEFGAKSIRNFLQCPESQ